MAMGMEIYAADGTLQANAELLGYYCRKSGTGTVQSTASAPLTYGNTVPATITVPVSGLGYTYPLVAVSCSGYYVARGMNALGGDFRFATDAPAGTCGTDRSSRTRRAQPGPAPAAAGSGSCRGT